MKCLGIRITTRSRRATFERGHVLMVQAGVAVTFFAAVSIFYFIKHPIDTSLREVLFLFRFV